MRNKDLVIKKLERVENLIIQLKRIVNSQEPREVYMQALDKLDQLIEESKDFVENEIQD